MNRKLTIRAALFFGTLEGFGVAVAASVLGASIIAAVASSAVAAVALGSITYATLSWITSKNTA